VVTGTGVILASHRSFEQMIKGAHSAVANIAARLKTRAAQTLAASSC
jgi:hypothetical protein